MKKNAVRAVAAAAVAGALMIMPMSSAFAASKTVSGTVSSDPTALKYTGYIGTVTVTGSNVRFYYDNGIGLGGVERLFLRMCKDTGDCSAFDTRTLDRPGNTYTMGAGVRSGTRFQFQHRAPDGYQVSNSYWAGTASWS